MDNETAWLLLYGNMLASHPYADYEKIAQMADEAIQQFHTRRTTWHGSGPQSDSSADYSGAAQEAPTSPHKTKQT